MTTFAASALNPAAEWPAVIVAVSFGLSALLLVVLVLAVKRATGGFDWLRHRAPSPKWSFESWALHLTAVGGVLGTVLGAVTLPEVPTQIDKEAVVALSLLFAALVVVAPFIYEAIRRWPKLPIPNPEEVGTGYVVVLLIACVIVFCGAFGELFTLGIIAWELTGGDAGGVVSEVGLGLLSVLAFYYVAVSAWEAAMSELPPPAMRRATIGSADASEVPARRESWSLP